MATKVYVTYTPSLNQSVTVKNGQVTKVTTWTTATPNSTERFIPNSGDVTVEMPNGKVIRSRKRATGRRKH